MEKRINEFAGPHQLDYLEYRLQITRSESGKYRRGIVLNKNGKKRISKIYYTTNLPVGLGYFTISQLHYILQIVAENYLTQTHLIAFKGINAKFLVKVMPKTDVSDPLNEKQRKPEPCEKPAYAPNYLWRSESKIFHKTKLGKAR